jgi:PAS domain S-box-containing protein
MRGGLFASLLAFPLGVVLITLVGGPAWRAMTTAGGLLGSLLLVPIGVAVGRLRELGDATKRELAGRLRAEAELRHSLEELRASEEALQQRNRELALLNTIGQSLCSTLELDKVLTTILEEARRLLDTVACSMWLVDPETDESVCQQASGPRSELVRGWRLAPGEGLAGWAARHGESLIVADAQADERHLKDVDRQTGLALRSILTVPLRARQDVIGVLQAVAAEVDRFGADDLTLLESMASSAAIAIENARLYEAAREELIERKRADEQIRRQAAVLEAINKVFRETLTSESDEEVARTCLAVAEELTGSSFGFVGELNQAGLFDTIAFSNPGWDACQMPHSEATRLTQNMELRGVDRTTLKEGTSRIVNDPASHPDSVGVPEGHPPVTCFLGVPLKQAGRTIGMIGLANKESGYTPADQEGVETLSVALVQALMRRRAEKSRLRLATAVEQSAEAIIIVDRGGLIQYVNPAFEQITGHSCEEAVGRSSQLLDSGAGDATPYQEVWRALRRGVAWSGRLAGEKKDGTSYVAEVTISPVQEASGQIGNYVIILRDATQEAALEAQLLQAQKMDAVGRLAGGIAHDFNNILTTITGYSELVLNELSPKDPLHADLEEIARAAERAGMLTRQLLAFSRKQILQPRVLNLNSVVRNVERMLRRLIGEDIEVIEALDPELGRAVADPGQIEQVIVNLTVNARDAMPHGGRLTLKTANVVLDEAYAQGHLEATPGRYVLLAVSDDGIGMTEEVKSHLFEPFFTTKGLGKGTGLGLATVHGIVKQSGGNIEVYSELGVGTTFKIYLPRVEDEPEGVERKVTPDALLRGTETVLLVEDEERVRELVRRALEQSGYTVLHAQQPDEALFLCERHTGLIDLLLTDVVMPGMSGRDLAERLTPMRTEMKVLYISGYTDNTIAHHGVLDEDVTFLHKPFTPAALARKVREVLDTPS